MDEKADGQTDDGVAGQRQSGGSMYFLLLGWGVKVAAAVRKK
jgi:hypothetical protein